MKKFQRFNCSMAMTALIFASANVAVAQTAPDFTFEVPVGDGVRTTVYSGTFLDLDLNTSLESPLTVLLIGEGYNTARALAVYSCESMEVSWDFMSYNHSLVDFYDKESHDYLPIEEMEAEILIAALDICE